jgi:predicted  nucleic acid-binding Zn-ribbon protein
MEPLRGLRSLLRHRLLRGISPRRLRRRGTSSRAHHPRQRIHRARVIALLALAVALGLGASSAIAQQPAAGPTVQELERLLDEREANIARSDARLVALEALADSLVRAKSRVDPGSAQYERISNQIRENSDQIRPLQRDLRNLHAEARDLQTQLFQRYNGLVAITQTRIDELRRQGRTSQNSPELAQLLQRLPDYLSARERYNAAVQEQQCAPWLPDLVLLADDSPSQLRYKEALARDAVDKINTCIQGIEKRIDDQVQKKRIKEEVERLQRDIRLWGDQRSAQARDQLEQILEGRDRVLGGAIDPFEDPDARIRELQRRRLDLVERREEYQTKARWFAQRLQEFYP